MVTDRWSLRGGRQTHAGTDRRRQRLRKPVDAQPRRVQQMEQRALLQQPHRPAGTGGRDRTQLPDPARQTGRLRVDHAGGRLLPQPVPRLLGRGQPAAQQVGQALLQLLRTTTDPLRPALGAAPGGLGIGRATARNLFLGPGAGATARQPFVGPAGRIAAWAPPVRRTRGATAGPARACTGTCGWGNCTCTPGPWCRPPSGRACSHCPGTAPRPRPNRPLRCPTTDRPNPACSPPCARRRQEPGPGPAPPSSAPPEQRRPRVLPRQSAAWERR